MEPNKRQHLQDIYATDEIAKDDFTPQIASEIVQERQREIRRHQMSNFFMGSTILALALGLVFVLVKKYIDIVKASEAPAPITTEYIPRYSLPSESQWVLDFPRAFADPKWNGEGERPFNSTWIKKATYNLILAEQAFEIGEFGESAEYYENALQILPDLEGVRVPLGMAYFKLEAFDRAIELLEDAPEVDLTPEVLNNLGAACIEAQAYDKGYDYLRQALDEKPTYAEALKNLAMLFRKQGKKVEATRAYEQYLDQRPLDTTTRHTFALYLTQIGDWKLAGEQLRKLTEEITDEANLYNILARVEIKLGNDKAAIEAMQRANRLTDPALATSWMSESEFDSLRDDPDFQALMRHLEKR